MKTKVVTREKAQIETSQPGLRGTWRTYPENGETFLQLRKFIRLGKSILEGKMCLHEQLPGKNCLYLIFVFRYNFPFCLFCLNDNSFSLIPIQLVFLEFKVLLVFFWSLLQVPCKALSTSGSLFLLTAEIFVLFSSYAYPFLHDFSILHE